MSLIIGGVQPFTTIDYPEKLAAVIFCKGCPLRCPYCQNPALQSMSRQSAVDWNAVCAFLDSRVRLLDAVVFSGGEPLMQPDLPDAVADVKKRGFLVGLHTSGVSADALCRVLPMTDWVGFDVKTLFDVYDDRIPHASGRNIRAALTALIDSGTPFEVRTTLDPRVISENEVPVLAKSLADMGVKHYAVQEYHSFPEEKNPPSKEATAGYFISGVLNNLSSLFDTFVIRRS